MDLIGIVLTVGALAQQAGESPDTSLIIDIVTNVGVSGLLALLYWDERKERRATQALNGALLERVLPALTNATDTLDRVQESQTAIRRADTDELERRLGDLVTELRRGQGDH